MTGFRVGIVAANKIIISAMTKLQGQNTTCLPEFVQEAALVAFMEEERLKNELDNMCKTYQERRDYALELFKQIPLLKPFKPQGAFYLLIDIQEYLKPNSSKKIFSDDNEMALKMLNEAHVATVAGTPFGIPGYLRLSIASSKSDIEKAVSAIKIWLD